MLYLMISTTKALRVGDVFQIATANPSHFCHNILLARRKTGLTVLRVEGSGKSRKDFLLYSAYGTTAWRVKTFSSVSFQNI